MTRFDSWESYFYPPPDGGTLRNLFDERDPDVLGTLECGATFRRQRQLERGEVAIARTYDGAHLQAVHRHLFKDVYERAGLYRTVNMAKGSGRGFGDVRTGEVDRYLVDAHRLVTSIEWGRLGRAEFAAKAGEVFAYVNQAHPFREGNGRASKVFMEHVAELSGFELDYSRVEPDAWNLASDLSRPDLYDYEPVSGLLLPVFGQIAGERTPASLPVVGSASRARSPLSASHPRPSYPSTALEHAAAHGQAAPAGGGRGLRRGEGRGDEQHRGLCAGVDA